MRLSSLTERTRVWTIGLSVCAAVVLFGLIFWQGSRRPVSSVVMNSPILVQDRARVLSDRASLLTLPTEDVTVYVPCCSFEVGGTVSIVDSEPNLFAEPPGVQSYDRPRIVNIEYYDPKGQLVSNATSSTPVEICFTFTADLWREYIKDKSKFAIQYYDDQHSPGEWKSMEVTDRNQQRSLCTKSNHLTLFALSIWKPITEVPTHVPQKTNAPYTLP